VNQVIDTIQKRRSVRRFDPRPISEDIIDRLIDAAHWAPTGMNSQPWRFVVVRNAAFRKKLVGLSLPRYKKWLSALPAEMQAHRKEVDATTSDPIYYGAPVIVFVIGTTGGTADYDCAMACQNIMLAARSLGIGSCWVYIGQLAAAEKEVQEALELKENETIYGPLVLGYPQGDFPVAPPKNAPVVKKI
jgi:nitroreductase